jgi:hypothetical protein
MRLNPNRLEKSAKKEVDKIYENHTVFELLNQSHTNHRVIMVLVLLGVQQ